MRQFKTHLIPILFVLTMGTSCWGQFDDPQVGTKPSAPVEGGFQNGGNGQPDAGNGITPNTIRTIGSMAGEDRSDNRVLSKNGKAMAFKWCPPGSFKMGDAIQEDVDFSSGFWMGKHEVTQGQYEQVMLRNPSGRIGNSLPVTNIEKVHCESFCVRMTMQEEKAGRLPKGWEYRMPTAAQWEYACRSGSTTNYSYGDDKASLGDYAWTRSNSDYHSHAVGTKKPNHWGIYDMHGNVMERCNDGGARGGSVAYPDEFHQSHYHTRVADDSSTRQVGFRIILVRK